MCSVTFDWSENDAMAKVRMFERLRGQEYGRLLWATVEFTELCNHKCIYCYENANEASRVRHMKRKRALELIRYMAGSGIRQLTCSGGEPLMYPYIKDVIREARESGMVVHMITNGYFLNLGLARELKALGLSQVQINIDSTDPRKHDFMRGKEGSFEHAVSGIRNAIKSGMTAVTQTVLTKLNENEIEDIFRFARSLGVQRCRVWDIVPSEGRAFSNMHLKPAGNYLETLKRLNRFALETGAVNIESGDPLFPQDIETGIPVTGGYCPYAIGLLTNISTEGNAFFCCTNRGKPMYNIFQAMDSGENLVKVHEESLKKAFERMQFFRLPAGCSGCAFLRDCKGGCYMRRLFAGYERDYWCERESRVLIKRSVVG